MKSSLALKTLLLFLIYFLTAKIGLSFDAVSGFATLVWAPTGIALVSLLIFGYELWPGIFLAAFLVNLFAGAPLLVALWIGMGNTLEAVVAVFLLKRFRFSLAMGSLEDVWKYIFLAVFLSTLISATVGTTSLWLGQVITSANYQKTWLAWLVGDMLGDLVVGAFLLIWFAKKRIEIKWNLKILELILIFSILIICGLAALVGLGVREGSQAQIAYIVTPWLVWLAVRFGGRGATAGILTVAALAVIGSIDGHGVFYRTKLSESLLLAQGFIGVNAITALVLAGLVTEKLDLEKKKNDFISTVSHELKTPVTSIKAYTDLLNQSLIGDKKLHKYLLNMNEESNRLIKLVNDLLDFNRIAAGKLVLNYEQFFIDELIKSITEDLAYINKDNKIIFKEAGKLVLEADKQLISQVLINLINNAIKFSPQKSKVTVSLQKKKKWVIASVKDAGIGIDQKDQQNIFNKYFQTETTLDSSVRGLGLGLYICSKIIKKHGGKIWVKSKLNKGSTFYFSLPVKAMGKIVT